MIWNAACGTIAFPRDLILCALMGIPSATRPTSGSVGHRAQSLPCSGPSTDPCVAPPDCCLSNRSRTASALSLLLLVNPLRSPDVPAPSNAPPSSEFLSRRPHCAALVRTSPPLAIRSEHRSLSRPAFPHCSPVVSAKAAHIPLPSACVCL